METETVSRYLFEGELARLERMISRLVKALVLTVILLFLSNLAWLYMWNLYDYEDTMVTVDSRDSGIANYIDSSGVINNGENRSQEED